MKGKPLCNGAESAGSVPSWWGSARPITLQGLLSILKVSFFTSVSKCEIMRSEINFAHAQCRAFGGMDDTSTENKSTQLLLCLLWNSLMSWSFKV